MGCCQTSCAADDAEKEDETIQTPVKGKLKETLLQEPENSEGGDKVIAISKNVYLSERDKAVDGGKGSYRWYVDLGGWEPDGGAQGEEFQFLMSLIKEEREREGVMRYTYFADQKRALVSRLMARTVCSTALQINPRDVTIARTKGSKPYLATPVEAEAVPNFNFNISHDGDYVVLAADGFCVCGVDVVAPGFRASRDSFSKEFTTQEWDLINSRENDEEKDKLFSLLWSCKESYTKARGDGLKFELARAEFSVVGGDDGFETNEPLTLVVAVDGVPMKRWIFSSMLLPDGYRVTVARGPTSDIVDALGGFTATLKRSIDSFTNSEWGELLDTPQPGFTRIPIGFLVPPSRHNEYTVVGGVLPPPSFLPVSPIYTPVAKYGRSLSFPRPPAGFMGSAGFSPRARLLRDEEEVSEVEYVS